jgi:hypothetical protein
MARGEINRKIKSHYSPGLLREDDESQYISHERTNPDAKGKM